VLIVKLKNKGNRLFSLLIGAQEVFLMPPLQ